jgi:hypothetical protein
MKTIIVTKPPVRVQYIGPITPEGLSMTKNILNEVRKYPYENYKFNPSLKVEVIYDGNRNSKKENLWN